MGRQVSLIQITGTVGNMSFYKTKDGLMARQKSGIDPGRIATDPAFARTRENLAEFGRAGKAGKLLRLALGTAIQQVKDSNMSNRLTRQMTRVIKADAVSVRGMRNVIDGETELLKGFEFNIASPLGSTLYAPYTAAIDRVTGTVNVNLEPFIPTGMIASPPGATHFVLMIGGAEVDFTENKYSGSVISSAALPLNGVLTAPIALTVPVTLNSTHPLFLAFGITFLQEVNGTQYALNSGAFNALTLAEVSGV
jgi:hypothetical protein